MQKYILVVLFSTMSLLISAQNVNIPDIGFKTYLLGNSAINTNADTEIQTSEAIAYTGMIDCGNLAITDLTGIEEFINLTELYCYSNALTSIDVSNNLSLTLLDCTDNQLSSLNVLSNTNLVYLYCGDNQLGSLNVIHNNALIDLSFGDNDLSNIDVSNNLFLEKLICYRNQLSQLDVSNNTFLKRIWCFENDITAIFGLSNCPLTNFFCYQNMLTELNLSSNINLTDLRCNDNLLAGLNLANGFNTDINNFYAFNNPNLTCIEVDDTAYSNSNWTQIDATATYSLDCGYCFTSINTIDTSICEGEIYSSPNFGTYTVTSIIYDTLQNACNGDSIIEINLTVLPADSTILTNEDFCAGDSLEFYGTNIISSGTYYHALINQNGCDSVLVKTFNQLTVNVSITNSNGTLEASNGLDSYQWFKDGIAIANETASSFTPVESGEYSCEAEGNSCSVVSNSIIIDLGTGINEISSFGIQLYPNPVNDILHIQKNNSSNVNRVEIYSTTGKLLIEEEHFPMKIKLAAYPAGLYFLVFHLEERGKENQLYHKLIVK